MSCRHAIMCGAGPGRADMKIARRYVIGGRVQGTVNASDRVEVQGTSVIIGDINTRALAVIEGGRINGSVRIADAKEPGADEQTHPSPVAVLR